MNRTLCIILAVAAAVVFVLGLVFYFKPPANQLKQEDHQKDPVSVTNPTAFDILEFLPPESEWDELDQTTKVAVNLLSKLLPGRKKATWPTRVITAQDTVSGDGRTVRVHLEKTLRLEVVELADAAEVTVSSDKGDNPASMQLGLVDKTKKLAPFTKSADVRKVLSSLDELRTVYCLGLEDPVKLLDQLNFELDPLSATVEDLAACPSGAKCFKVAIRSAPFKVELAKVNKKWTIKRIAPAS